MKANAHTNINSGIAFSGMLAILFIGLKLAELISWSWLWVLSPLWITFSFKLFIILLLGLGVYIGAKRLDR